ncbi:unnamed protein product [Paramecium sonneborni]|uniref:Uncharacterized protein n=1 Tax=Paramecium sonneborni TaxID=65129 RepID=A0A8S1QQT5_9CILI|nr:unnamed protein product [Paramecium sonneborni]
MESISWERRCYCIPFTFYVCVVPFKFASDNLDLNYPADKFKMSGQIQVIYFDVEVFNKFMDGNFELPFGILQQFIEPADDLNSQIQAFWSKSVTLFTKRVCKMSFTNKSLNIYERHCTFEGPEYFSEASMSMSLIVHKSLSERFLITENLRINS